MVENIGFADGNIVERFDCYEGTPAKAKLSKDLYVQGVNFFARKPGALGESDRFERQGPQNNQDRPALGKKVSFQP